MKKILLLLVVTLAINLNAESFLDVYPPMNKPDHIYCVNESALTSAENLMLQTFSGILAKTKPRIMFMEGEATDLWLSEMTKKGITHEDITDLWILIDKFKSELTSNRYLLCDLNQESMNVATSLAGPFGAVVIDPSLQSTAEEHGLKMYLDLRGKTEEWCFSTYKQLFNKKMAADRNYTEKENPSWLRMRDFIVAGELFCFYDWKNGALREKVMNSLDIDAPMVGWGAQHENTFVIHAAKHACYNLPINWALNMTLYSSLTPYFKPEELYNSKKKRFCDITWEKSKHYVMFMITDGDNLCWHTGNTFAPNPKYWKSPYRGKFPFSWTISPASRYLAPLTLAYVNRTQEQDDSFVPALSGAGYFHFDYYGQLRGGQSALDLHLERLNEVMKKSGWNTIEVMSGDKSFETCDLSAYAEKLEGLQGILWIKYSPYCAGKGRIIWIKNSKGIEIPASASRYALWDRGNKGSTASGSYFPAEIISDLATLTKNELEVSPGGALFTWINVHAWSFDEPLGKVQETINGLDTNTYRIVNSDEYFMQMNLHERPGQTLKNYAERLIKEAGEKNRPELVLQANTAMELVKNQMFEKCFEALQWIEKAL